MSDESLTQVVEGVHRYADGLVNWYLIEDGGELTLVDAGWPRSWGRVQAAVGQLGHPITAIVLTHAHPDHLGAAEPARKATGAPVHVHRDEVARAHGDAKGSSPFTLVPSLLPTLWQPTALGFVLHAAARGFMTPTWVSDVTPFASHEQLDVPGRPWAIPTPGHTAGHVSLHLPQRGVVITGDALATLDVLTRATGSRLMPDALNSDPAQTRASLDALTGLDAGTLLPGHGDPFGGSPADAVAQARERDTA
ncbi:MAG: MBL fold metallo-hydrolase [Actinomycetota bacterium]|nr:MBL fold metallo-hydrolase [Actinomycetota bacterium]